MSTVTKAETLELEEIYGGGHTSVRVMAYKNGLALRASLYDASVVVDLAAAEARKLADLLNRYAAELSTSDVAQRYADALDDKREV